MGDIQQDPSMEKILASIKRVIADDSRAPAPRARRIAVKEPPPMTGDEDVLELDDPVDDDGLLSDEVAAASRDRLSALSALRLRPEAPIDTSPLESVIREMLRPMLKSWLDEHLPELVEQLSRAKSPGYGRDLRAVN